MTRREAALITTRKLGFLLRPEVHPSSDTVLPYETFSCTVELQCEPRYAHVLVLQKESVGKFNILELTTDDAPVPRLTPSENDVPEFKLSHVGTKFAVKAQNVSKEPAVFTALLHFVVPEVEK